MAGHRRAAAVYLVRGQLARHEHGGRGAAAQRRSGTVARVLLTGGGTGGHIYPALAIAEVLRERCAERPAMLFVGSAAGLERELVPKAGVPLAFVESRALSRRWSLDVARTLAANALGLAQAMRVVARFAPDCVVATGGYVTFPVVLAARMLRLAGIVHARIALVEPNAAPGLTNRLLRPLVDETWGAVPVRASILRPRGKEEARRGLGLEGNGRTVVVFGGSQGARRLNDATLEAARRRLFPPDLQVLLVTGARDAQRVNEAPSSGVHVLTYLEDPGAAYAAADLVVARAGASTLAELAATGTPSILVPYPYATGDHQMKNARLVERRGAARVLLDRDVNGERLASEVAAALEPATATSMRRAADLDAARDARGAVFERISVLVARG